MIGFDQVCVDFCLEVNGEFPPTVTVQIMGVSLHIKSTTYSVMFFWIFAWLLHVRLAILPCQHLF